MGGYDHLVIGVFTQVPRRIVNGDHLALTKPGGHRHGYSILLAQLNLRQKRTQSFQVRTKLIGRVNCRNERKKLALRQHRTLTLFQLIQQGQCVRHVQMGHFWEVVQQALDIRTVGHSNGSAGGVIANISASIVFIRRSRSSCSSSSVGRCRMVISVLSVNRPTSEILPNSS